MHSRRSDEQRQIPVGAQHFRGNAVKRMRVPVSEAVPMAMKAAIAARPDCKAQIEAEVRKAYPDFEKDNRSMNGAGKPAEGDAKAHLENGGTANDNNRRPPSGGRRKR